MWNGAVGSSWNADRNTVNVNPHITKKAGVKRRSLEAGIDPESVADGLAAPAPAGAAAYSVFRATIGSTRVARHAGTTLASSAISGSAIATKRNVTGSPGVTS